MKRNGDLGFMGSELGRLSEWENLKEETVGWIGICRAHELCTFVSTTIWWTQKGQLI